MSAFALNTQLIASLFFNMLKRYCYCRGWLYLFRKLFVLRSFRSPMRVWIPKELFSPLKNRPLFQKAKFHPQWFLCDPFGVQKCIWKCELEMAYAVCLWKSADSKWIETEVLVCCSEPPDGTWNGRDRQTTLVDPFFPHLSLPPSVPAPLPLPAPGGVSAPLRQGWGAAGTFQNWLELAGAATPCPHRDQSLQPCWCPVRTEEESDLPFTLSPTTLTWVKFTKFLILTLWVVQRGQEQHLEWGCTGTAHPFCNGCLQDQSMQ